MGRGSTAKITLTHSYTTQTDLETDKKTTQTTVIYTFCTVKRIYTAYVSKENLYSPYKLSREATKKTSEGEDEDEDDFSFTAPLEG